MLKVINIIGNQDEDLVLQCGEARSVLGQSRATPRGRRLWALVAKVLWIAVNWMLTSMR